MCLASSPKIPAPVKYAAIKTPNEGALRAGDTTERRRRAAASRGDYAGRTGAMAQPALALKSALGG